MIEDDYIRYRLSASKYLKLLVPFLNLPFMTNISCKLFRKVAGMVILAQKHSKLNKTEVLK